MRHLILALCALTAVSCGGGESGSGDGSGSGGDTVVLEIAGNDNMMFDKKSMSVKAGSTVTIKFTNAGSQPIETMGHNFILLTAGVTALDFGAAVAAPESGATVENGYVPTEETLKSQMIVSTGLIGPGESVEVTFSAPTEVGGYEYVCTFPGHYAMMRGVLSVTP